MYLNLKVGEIVSNNIEILISGSLNPNTTQEIKSQIQAIEKDLDKIELKIDTSALKKVGEDLEKMKASLGKMATKSVGDGAKGLKESSLEMGKMIKSIDDVINKKTKLLNLEKQLENQYRSITKNMPKDDSQKLLIERNKELQAIHMDLSRDIENIDDSSIKKLTNSYKELENVVSSYSKAFKETQQQEAQQGRGMLDNARQMAKFEGMEDQLRTVSQTSHKYEELYHRLAKVKAEYASYNAEVQKTGKAEKSTENAIQANIRSVEHDIKREVSLHKERTQALRESAREEEAIQKKRIDLAKMQRDIMDVEGRAKKGLAGDSPELARILEETKLLSQMQEEYAKNINEVDSMAMRDLKAGIDEVKDATKQASDAQREFNKAQADSARDQSSLLTEEGKLDRLHKNIEGLSQQGSAYEELKQKLNSLTQTYQEYQGELEKTGSVESNKLANFKNDVKALDNEVKRQRDAEIAREKEIQAMYEMEVQALEAKEAQIAKYAKAGFGIQQLGRGLESLTAPIIALGKESVDAFVSFESAFAGVRKTTTASEGEFKAIEEEIRSMTTELPKSAEEIAGIGEVAGQLGIKTENMTDFIRVMTMMGDVTTMTSAEVADSMARFANITNMSQGDFDRLGSTLLDLGNNLATSEKEILDMSLRLAGAGRQIGLTEHEITALAGAMSSAGIKAEAGGTSMTRLMVDMQMASESAERAQKVFDATGMSLRELEMTKSHDSEGFGAIAEKLSMTKKELGDIIESRRDLENFSKVVGVSANEFANMFKDDAMTGIKAFIDGLGKIEESGGSVIAVLDDMGITQVRLRDTILKTVSVREVLDESLDRGKNAWETNSELASKAGERYKTTASQMQIMRNQIAEVAREIGENLVPMVLKGLQVFSKITQTLSKLPPSLQKGLFGSFLIAGGAGRILSTFGRFMGGLAGLQRMFIDTNVIVTEAGEVFKSTGKVITSTGGEVAQMVTTTGGLFKGLLSGFSMSKWALGAVGAIGLVAGGIAVYRRKVREAREERDLFVESYPKELVKKGDDVKYLESIKDEFRELQHLVGKDGDLSLMTDTQKERYQEIVAGIQEVSPELETFYNRQGELVANTTTEIERLIDAKKKEMDLDKEKAGIEVGKKYKKDLKDLQKQIRALDDLKASLERYQRVIATGRDERGNVYSDNEIQMMKDGIGELEKSVKEAESEIRESVDNISQYLSEYLATSVGDFNNLEFDASSIRDSITGFVEEGMKEDAILYRVDILGEVLKEMDELFSTGMTPNTDAVADYVAKLEEAGFTVRDINDTLYKNLAINDSSEQAMQSLSRAYSEFNNSGKLSKDTISSLREHFSGLPEDIQKIDAEFVKSIAKSDEWLAVWFTTSLEVTKGYTEALSELNKEQLGKTSVSDVVSYEELEQEIEKARKVKDEKINILREEKAEKAEIVRMMYEELGLLTESQYNEVMGQLNDGTEKQISAMNEMFNNQKSKLSEMGEAVRTELGGALGEVIAGTTEAQDAWNSLSPDAKEFVAKQVGLDDVSKMTDEVFQKWLDDPETLFFVAQSLGLLETKKDVKSLQKYWDELSPEVKQFIAESFGVKDVKNASEETMKSWLQKPEIKEFIMYMIDEGKVKLNKEQTDEVWAIDPKTKEYISVESGSSNVVSQVKKTREEFERGGLNPKKTFLQRIKTLFVGESPDKNWRGNKNFKGGLSYVGERGRELLVYPDNTYDLSGDGAELRMLPKGTRIYNNPDTERILQGHADAETNKKQKIKFFAKGNAKARKATSNKSRGEKPNRIEIEEAFIRSIKIQNDHLEKRQDILKREYDLAKKIEGARGVLKQYKIVQAQIENNTKLIETYRKEQAKFNNEAKYLRKQYKKYNTESWFDANAEQTVEYVRQYNKASRKQQEEMDRLFGKIQKLKKAWLESNEEVKNAQQSTQELTRELEKQSKELKNHVKMVIEKEKELAYSQLEAKQRVEREKFDAEKKKIKEKEKQAQAQIDQLQKEIKDIQDSEKARKDAKELAERIDNLNKLKNKYNALINKDLASLSSEQAKLLGLEQERVRAIEFQEKKKENLVKLAEMELKLLNTRKNLNIKQLKKNNDGSWEFQYVADEREIKKQSQQMDELKEQMLKDEERYNDDLLKQKESLYEQLKKMQEDFDDYTRQKAIENEIDRKQREIDKYNSELQALKDALSEKEEASNDYYDKQKESLDRYYSDMDGLTNAKFEDLYNTFDGNWDKIVENLTSHFNRIDEAYKDLLSSFANSYIEADLPDGFNDFSKLNPKKETTNKGKEISSNAVKEGWGIGRGTTNDPNKIKELKKKLENEDYVQSEIDRANTVIANRKKAGMDTSAQEKYLDSLKKKQNKFKSGGETNVTGVHWLDGKIGKPERVLSAEQTKAFNKLVENLPKLNSIFFDSLGMDNTLLSSLISVPQLGRAGASQSNTQKYYIEKLEFPNVKDSNDIKDALEDLPIYVEQWKHRR